MKTLIAYASKYGAAADVAERVRACVGGAVAIDLKRTPDVNPAEYDAVVIGGPIYAGRIAGAVTTFCDRNRDALLARPVHIFITCLYTGEKAEAQLNECFPPWLVAHARAKIAVGGRIAFDRLKFFDRLIIKKVAGISADVDQIDHSAIDALCGAVTPGPTG